MGYVDSFNLYFGLRSRGWLRFLWLDASALVHCLSKPIQKVSGVKYFTARLSVTSRGQRAQTALLDAYCELGCCSLHFGQYQLTSRRCTRCGFEAAVPSEKMTDVNIAVELLADAVRDAYDTALLISADSDLIPAILKVKELFPRKRVIVAFPPGRFSQRLSQVADGYLVIGRAKLAASQLPDRIEKPDGFVLERPDEWR
jgi:hypothetical protein